MKKYTTKQIEDINKIKDLKTRAVTIKFYDNYNKICNYLDCTETLKKGTNTAKNNLIETETEITLTLNKLNDKAFKKMTSKQAYLLQNNSNATFSGSPCGFGYYVNRITVTEASKLIDAVLNNKKVIVKA